MSSQNTEIIKYPLVYDPITRHVYEDDISIVNIKYLDVRKLKPIMNVGRWMDSSGANAGNTKDYAASVMQDVSLSHVFYGDYARQAEEMFGGLNKAYEERDRDYAASVITSQDYQTLQKTIVLGESLEKPRTGILGQAFEEITVDNLKGDWADFTTNVIYHRNVPEGKSVEPSKGAATTIPILINKHEGAVAITEMAEQVINGAPVFQRLTSALANARLKSENEMIAEELENATTVLPGVDFGLRAGAPPLSSNNPQDTTQQLLDALDLVGEFNTIMSKGIVFNEYRNNDTNKGIHTPFTSPQTGSKSGPAPNLDGVTWYRDNAIALGTKLWAMDADLAIKLFRSITRSFQVIEPKEERKTQYLKSHFQPKIVQQSAIIEVTGVTA